jgi:ferric-chelate reductase (NADPH)
VPSIAQRVADAAARLVLKPATVVGVEDHDGFRTIEVAGERLAAAEWVPGDKLRIRTEGLSLRTYTPVSCDHDAGRTRLLAYTHGSGPGSEWCRQAQPGLECEVRGPDRSVRLDRVDGPVIFVGDETSFGLLLAWRAFRPESAPAGAIFEVANRDAAGATLDAHAAIATQLVERTSGEQHRAALAQATVDAVRDNRDATLVLTGCAQTIAVVRRHVKSEGCAPSATLVKAYWDENRKGLD